MLLIILDHLQDHMDVAIHLLENQVPKPLAIVGVAFAEPALRKIAPDLPYWEEHKPIGWVPNHVTD